MEKERRTSKDAKRGPKLALAVKNQLLKKNNKGAEATGVLELDQGALEVHKMKRRRIKPAKLDTLKDSGSALSTMEEESVPVDRDEVAPEDVGQRPTDNPIQLGDVTNVGGEADGNGNDKKKLKKKRAKTLSHGERNIELSKDDKPDRDVKAHGVDAYEIPSVDEDCSRGMRKWIAEYNQSRPGLKALQQQIDEFIVTHEEQQEQERKEREARAAEGGWTVVVHQKGRKKTTDAESGISVGSVSQAAVLHNMAKKKKKEDAAPAVELYRFQKKEAHRNEIMMLQSKFEQEKKRIQQLRAQRKFRPY